VTEREISYIELCWNSPTAFGGRVAFWSGIGTRSRDGKIQAVMPRSVDDKMPSLSGGGADATGGGAAGAGAAVGAATTSR
jgi:hypothetical protein